MLVSSICQIMAKNYSSSLTYMGMDSQHMLPQ